MSEIKTFLRYEIQSSWWAQYVSNPMLQEWASRYYVWKVTRKYKRYLYRNVMKKQLMTGD